MSAKRIAMRKIKEILRLSLAAHLSVRQIKSSTHVSLGAIQKILTTAREHNISWPIPDDWDDQVLMEKLYPKPLPRRCSRYEEPVWFDIHQEIKKKGVTMLLLWEEYREHAPENHYSYSQYCSKYRKWAQNQKRSMRLSHKAGEKLFLDYAGQTIPIVCGSTGECHDAQIFVAVMGASNYTYAEATWTQQLPDWLGSHVRAFNFFGGVPELLIPDNLRSAVNQACRYDPSLNPSYQQLAAHYDVAVIPARPYKPKDKAKVEVGVQIVERWILAKLRHHTFFSLAELNHCIKILLIDLNNRIMKQWKGSRKEWFETLDKPALKSLPVLGYVFMDIKRVKVGIDYHITYKDHLYSVPHIFIGETLECHASESRIELYFNGKSVVTHQRSARPGTTTLAHHMPEKHQKHQRWSPERLMHWSSTIGSEVELWVKDQLSSRKHPEQAYRACLGLLSLSRQYPNDRLNNACKVANHQSLRRLKQIKSILNAHLDKLPVLTAEQRSLPQDHSNVRGPQSFH